MTKAVNDADKKRIEKLEEVELNLKHEISKLKVSGKTGRVLCFSLRERRPRSVLIYNSTILMNIHAPELLLELFGNCHINNKFFSEKVLRFIH